MKAVLTIIADTPAEAEAIGRMLEVEVEKVVITVDGELLDTELRPLLIEGASVFVAPPTEDARKGPRIRLFTDAPTATTEDMRDDRDDIAGGAPQAEGRKGRRAKSSRSEAQRASA